MRTRARESSAALSSKDGFSVVAPTSTMVPSSISGRKASCCALLKRWISSTKSSVPRPFWRRRRAASKIFFRSATPVKIALICTKARSVASASSRAMVVLPTPGGPQKTIEPRLPVGEHPAERTVGAEEVLLPDHLVEPPRAQAVGERPRRLGGRRGRLGRAPVEKISHRPSDTAFPAGAPRGRAHGSGRPDQASAVAASSAATRALSPAPLAAASRSTSSMIAIGAASP